MGEHDPCMPSYFERTTDGYPGCPLLKETHYPSKALPFALLHCHLLPEMKTCVNHNGPKLPDMLKYTVAASSTNRRADVVNEVRGTEEERTSNARRCSAGCDV